MPARVTRERREPTPAELQRYVAPPQKTWEELTPEEREEMMKKIAEERGYVKK